MAEKIRSLIAQVDFEEVSHITASLGLSLFEHGESSRDTIKRADDALYIAKEQGRNCVVVHEDCFQDAGMCI